MNPYLLASIITVGVLALLFGVFLFLIAPGRRNREKMKRYENLRYAHRGLHSEGVPENSLAAFSLAVDRGYAIELDVRLSRDGVLVVFHDDTLTRVAGIDKRVDELTLDELKELRLLGTDERIPTFAEVLSLVDGRVPLLVEIKEDVFKYSVTECAVKMLREYKGDFIVESFNPLALARFRKLYPEIPLGLLSMAYTKNKEYKKLMYRLVELFTMNFLSRPDFIAYDHTAYKNPPFRLLRAFFHPPLLCWTIRTESEEARAIEHGFTGIIFEGYNSQI